MRKYYKLLIPTFYVGIVAVMVVSILLVVTGIKNYINESNNMIYTLEDKQ